MTVVELHDHEPRAHLIPAVKPLKIIIGSDYSAIVTLYVDTARRHPLDFSIYNGADLVTAGGGHLPVDIGQRGQLAIKAPAALTGQLSPKQTTYQVHLFGSGVRHIGVVGPLSIVEAV